MANFSLILLIAKMRFNREASFDSLLEPLKAEDTPEICLRAARNDVKAIEYQKATELSFSFNQQISVRSHNTNDSKCFWP